jgi:type II secretory pathway component GspD/PulD (secretin)
MLYDRDEIYASGLNANYYCGAARNDAARHAMPFARQRAGRGMRRVAIATVLGLLACAAGARAAEPNWPGEKLAYTVIDEDLRDVLADLGNRIGVPVNVSQAVRGHVRGHLPDAPPRQFLDNLAAMYGLNWYYDGGTLYVTRASEQSSRLVTLGPVQLADLTSTLDQLGVSDARWPVRGAADGGVAIVSGPPRYVQLVGETLQNLIDRAKPKPDEAAAQVRIFHGVVTGRSS